MNSFLLSYILFADIRLTKNAQKCFSFEIFMMHGDSRAKVFGRMMQMKMAPHLTNLNKSMTLENAHDVARLQAWDCTHAPIGKEGRNDTSIGATNDVISDSGAGSP